MDGRLRNGGGERRRGGRFCVGLRDVGFVGFLGFMGFCGFRVLANYGFPSLGLKGRWV